MCVCVYLYLQVAGFFKFNYVTFDGMNINVNNRATYV